MVFEVAQNLDEYCNLIDKYNNGPVLWYRGMSSAGYYLTPSLFRKKKVIGLEYSGREINGRYYRKSDAVMKSDLAAIDKFISHYDNFYPEKSKDFKLIDYLYLMQHYEIPTRLLDFSTNELAALYFSVSSNNKIEIFDTELEIEEFKQNSGYTDRGSSVHIIDPAFTNENTNEFVNLKGDILNIDDIDIDVLSGIIHPICVETSNQDPRIINQKGNFILFGKDYKSYEDYQILNEKIIKIFIPNSCRKQIKNELKVRCQISHTDMYPDIKGISLDIIDEIEDKYESDCKSIFG